MKLGKHVFLSLFIWVVSHTSAHSEWYWGADSIESSNWFELESLAADAPVPADKSGRADMGHKIFSGFKASDSFSVELELRDKMEFGIGNLFSEETLWQGDKDQKQIDAKTLMLSGQSTVQIDESKTLFLRGGFYNWDIQTNNLDFTDELYIDREGTDLFYSIGAAFDFTKSFRVRAEWERFEVDDDDVDFISTEFRLSF